MADAQYQPAYIDPNSSSGAGTRTDSIFKKITDENIAIDAMASYYSKKGVKISRSEIQKQYRSAAAALANPSLQENARKHVGGRTEFLGRPTAGAVWRGSGADNRFLLHMVLARKCLEELPRFLEDYLIRKKVDRGKE